MRNYLFNTEIFEHGIFGASGHVAMHERECE